MNIYMRKLKEYEAKMGKLEECIFEEIHTKASTYTMTIF